MIPKIDNAIRTIILTGDAQTDLYIRIGITIALIIIVFWLLNLQGILIIFCKNWSL